MGCSYRERPTIAAGAASGTRPVAFKIERIDEAESDEEREWLAGHDFRIGKDDAYTGAQR